MSSETVIETQDLGKAYHIYRKPVDRLKQMLWRGRRQFYDEFWALQGVSVSVKRGETVGIIGKNGSGKSTFLQVVCGTLQPSHGSLSVKGRVAALLELGAGFNPEFTGRENVYLAASVLGLTSFQIDERLPSILDFAGIGDFIDQPVKIYSSGMYARLAFAVAAHVDADVLIIDEILAVGDIGFTQKCMSFIRAFKERGTIFFVSHDMGAVVNLCDRVLWLDSGRIRSHGDPKTVCREYVAAIQAEKDASGSFRIGGGSRAAREDKPPVSTKTARDERHEMLKDSNLRNVLQVFDFDPEAPWFGQRGISIVNVSLVDEKGESLRTIHGGEVATLQISCLANAPAERPIVGFYVKDRLGQQLFGDNTFLSYQYEPLHAAAGEVFTTQFTFLMPYLPTGDFTVTVAVSEGTQEHHVTHHWIDEALTLNVVASHVVRGLVGVPMLKIEMSRKEGASQEVA